MRRLLVCTPLAFLAALGACATPADQRLHTDPSGSPEVARAKENEARPPPDADHDGLADNVDLCPQLAGPQENHGCPWVDAADEQRWHEEQFAIELKDLAESPNLERSQKARHAAGQLAGMTCSARHDEQVAAPVERYGQAVKTSDAPLSAELLHAVSSWRDGCRDRVGAAWSQAFAELRDHPSLASVSRASDIIAQSGRPEALVRIEESARLLLAADRWDLAPMLNPLGAFPEPLGQDVSRAWQGEWNSAMAARYERMKQDALAHDVSHPALAALVRIALGELGQLPPPGSTTARWMADRSRFGLAKLACETPLRTGDSDGIVPEGLTCHQERRLVRSSGGSTRTVTESHVDTYSNSWTSGGGISNVVTTTTRQVTTPGSEEWTSVYWSVGEAVFLVADTRVSVKLRADSDEVAHWDQVAGELDAVRLRIINEARRTAQATGSTADDVADAWARVLLLSVEPDPQAREVLTRRWHLPPDFGFRLKYRSHQ